MESAPAIERTYPLAPSSRRTVQLREDADLVGQAFGITVTFAQPGMAERAMYFGETPTFRGGHESAGVTAPSTTWLLAEGATGGFFETFILVANPNADPADVTFTFLSDITAPATLTRTIAPLSRITINPEAEDLSIPDGAVATQVTATRPVVAERAQYWPFDPGQWTEAHNSFGVTEAATKWGLAEGRAGGARGYQTFVLLANPGTSEATVTLLFLPDTTNGTPTPAEQTVRVPPQSRRNVLVEIAGAPAAGLPVSFGTAITSDQPIVVERALNWNADGQFWAAGTNATATRLP